MEEVYLETRKATYYTLHLEEAGEEIVVSAFAKPEKIVDAYLDQQFLVFVYKSKSGYHFLTGAYKNEGQWETDYFHQQLELSNGLYGESVEQVQILDASTVLLSYQIKETGKEERKEVRFLRITKDHIRTYRNQDDVSEYDRKGNNPIRPER